MFIDMTNGKTTKPDISKINWDDDSDSDEDIIGCNRATCPAYKRMMELSVKELYKHDRIYSGCLYIKPLRYKLSMCCVLCCSEYTLSSKTSGISSV
jgi:hypothetical protein